MEEEVDLSKELTRQQYEAIVSKALDTHEQDAEIYLKKVQARMERSAFTILQLWKLLHSSPADSHFREISIASAARRIVHVLHILSYRLVICAHKGLMKPIHATNVSIVSTVRTKFWSTDEDSPL